MSAWVFVLVLGPVGDSRLNLYPTAPSLDICSWIGSLLSAHIVLCCKCAAVCFRCLVLLDLIPSLPLLFTHLCVCVCMGVGVFEYAYFKQICGQLSVALGDSVFWWMFILKRLFLSLRVRLFLSIDWASCASHLLLMCPSSTLLSWWQLTHISKNRSDPLSLTIFVISDLDSGWG